MEKDLIKLLVVPGTDFYKLEEACTEDNATLDLVLTRIIENNISLSPFNEVKIKYEYTVFRYNYVNRISNFAIDFKYLVDNQVFGSSLKDLTKDIKCNHDKYKYYKFVRFPLGNVISIEEFVKNYE